MTSLFKSFLHRALWEVGRLLRNYAVVGITVRREKALDFSGCNSRPGTGSLHPVAIRAAVEETRLLKPLV